MTFRVSSVVLDYMFLEDSRGVAFRLPLLADVQGDAAKPYLFCSINPRRGTLRGFHLQSAPYEESKLISCIAGSLFLAVFDPDPLSTAKGRLNTYEIKSANPRSVFVGPGLATAWLTLEDDTVVHYQISGEYSPKSASGFRYDDPQIGVSWPMKPNVIADKDLMWKWIGQ